MQPDQYLELEAQLVRVAAHLSQVVPPATLGYVVRAPLEQAGSEVPRQPFAQPGNVLAHELLLQRMRVGRDHHALTMADRPGDRRHEVGQAFARSGARLNDQRSAAA